MFGWTADESTSHAMLDHFVAGGFNLVDTADIYSTWVPGHVGGESETILGKWLARAGNRNRIVLATKVGMERRGAKGLRREHVLQAAEESLSRLRTDHIDLYQTHIDDPETPVDETLEALSRLVRDGKVRAIGASQYSVERLAASLAASERLGLPRYDTLQPEFNLFDRKDFEETLQPLALAHGLGVIPFFGLARGFLTGKYRKLADLEGRARASGLKRYFEGDRGLRILAALDAVASHLGSTPAKVSLAWIMAQPTIAAPIASATSIEQLGELMDAAHLVLDAEALATLDRASS